MSAGRTGILFVHCADEWYGSDVVLYDTVRTLEGSEFDAQVVLPDDVESELPAETRLSARLRALGVPVTVAPLAVMRRRYLTVGGIARLAARSHSSVGAVLRAVDSSRIGIVHSHTASVLTGARIAARLGVPHVWHVSEIVQRPAIVRHLLARGIARSADRVIAVSAAVRDHLCETAPRIGPKCDIIFNALDVAPFMRVTQAAACAHLGLTGELVVGMVGRVGTMKGQEVLLAAAPAILKEHPNTTFLLVGGVLHKRFVDMDRLLELAAKLGVAEHVRILGFNVDVAEVLAAMDVVVQPSIRPESFGMTVLEAMASGKPVVAAAHGGVMEVVRQGETGFLTPAGDASALAGAVNVLLSNPDMRARMGSAGRMRVHTQFSPSNFRERYLSVYRDISQSKV